MKFFMTWTSHCKKYYQPRKRREFADRTILTIAHRIDTILDYDRILVFEKGQLIEDGRPKNLLEDQSSKFYELAKAKKHNWMEKFLLTTTINCEQSNIVICQWLLVFVDLISDSGN